MEMLGADIAKYEATAGQLAKDITGLDAQISTWEGNLKAATKVRKAEAEDYDTTFKDYGESIEALEKGIAVMKKEDHATKQAAAALMQISSASLMSSQVKKKIDAYLAQDWSIRDESLTQLAAPEANAYEFQ